MKTLRSTPAQVVTAAAATIALLYFFCGILAPFFLAIVLVVVIHAIADVIVSLFAKAPRWMVIVLTGVLVSAVIIVSFDVVLHGLRELLPQMQKMAVRLQELLRDAASAFGVADAPKLKVLLGNADLPGLAQTALTSVTGALTGVGLVIMFLAFLLASQPTINSKITIVAASSSREEKFNAVLRQIDRGVRDCIVAQTLSAALIAAGAGVVMLAIGLQNALFWAILIFLVSYIPVFGGFISCVAPALFALVQFPTIWQAATIVVALQAIVTFVGSFVLPKMQSARQNIDPAVGILAFSIWTLLWGIPGAILAYPLTLTLMIVFVQFDATRWIAVLMSNDGKPAPSLDAEAVIVLAHQQATFIGLPEA